MTAENAFYILLSVAIAATGGYMTWRGATRNEFRERGRWGWHSYKPGSGVYWSAMSLNVMFMLGGLFLLYLQVWRPE